ncbi:MAG TPA: ComF family protein, partial [Chthoniobacterales bacterium]|nr:ComF family protein [Chthoniobacterales bacterium]
RIQPPFCQTCSRPFSGAIPAPFRCPHCEDNVFAFDCAVSPYLARGAVRELIHRLKYNGQFHLRNTIADWLWVAFSDPRISEEPFDAIVPVPLHPVRQRERGYDQVSALAEIVARRAEKPLLKCLQRRRYTQTQTVLDRDDRERNLHDAFELRKSTAVLGKRILLLDDVLTTGTTLHECAKVLRSGGAISIRAVTVARG